MKTAKLARVAGIFEGRGLGFCAALAGATCFLLALLLALLLAWPQGNPGFLVIWLAAAGMTASYMRVHRKWRTMFERIYAMQPARTILAARKNWRRSVEDVVFRELPGEPVAFRK